MPLRLGLAAALAVTLGCATPRPPRPVQAPQPAAPTVDAAPAPPAAAPVPSSAPVQAPADTAGATPAPAACANAQYGFQCSLPAGYVLTQEGAGPGTIMSFAKRALGSEDAADLAVRVAPMHGEALDAFVQKRVSRDLQRATGVAHVEQRPLTLGDKAGIEILVDRAYASGPYRSRIFCFAHGDDLFIVDLTAPAGQFDGEKGALDSFVTTLTFS